MEEAEQYVQYWPLSSAAVGSPARQLASYLLHIGDGIGSAMLGYFLHVPSNFESEGGWTAGCKQISEN